MIKEIKNMEENGWNFHGHIALNLETKLKDAIWAEKQFEVSADNIESGSFAELILFLLVKKYGFTADVLRLIEDGSDYISLPASQIPSDVAKCLYDRFMKLYFGEIH